MTDIHPASLKPTQGAGCCPASSSTTTPKISEYLECPFIRAQNAKFSAQPDLFVPGGSKGFMDPNTKGKGVGVVLDEERSSSTFPVEQMKLLLHGGSERLARRRYLISRIENNPVFRKWDKHFLSRAGRITRGSEKLHALINLQKELNLTDPAERFILTLAVEDILPHELHKGMFLPTLQSQASDAQQAAWLPQALGYKMLGTYAQTELGHGSFVRGLETTATYDPETEQFILNSPTLTSTKWWPGNLGKHATHCVLMARLISQGKDHGIHAFYLQLRDTTTYEVLPGRILGDIGPKMGYESNDNGFLRLDHVPIPRFNHLARYMEVGKDGTVAAVPGAPKHSKLAYLTMVFTRSMIVLITASQLGKAVTIAIRYSAVRKQFPDHHPSQGNQGKESAVLNYQTQQLTLFPLLAMTYAFHFTGQFMRKLYFDSVAKVSSGDTSVMAELHATSSGLKALCTTLASTGIEDSRRSCGGHGYSRFSGIVDLYLDYLPSQTYEGDNTVMYLQTARSLVKLYGGIRSGKIPPPQEGAQTFYMVGVEAELAKKSSLKSPSQISSASIESSTIFLTALSHRCARLLSSVSASLASSRQSHPKWTLEQHMDKLKVPLVRFARTHCLYVLAENFYKAILESGSVGGVPKELKPVLKQLADLFSISIIINDMGDFTEDGYFNLEQSTLLRTRQLVLLEEIRPNAISLVDSFDFTDHFLNSSLGRYDGNVYQSLWDWAQRNPLNDPVNSIGPGIQDHILPLLEGRPIVSKL